MSVRASKFALSSNAKVRIVIGLHPSISKRSIPCEARSFAELMSADPVILDVLASICKDALQMFERVVIVFDDKACGCSVTHVRRTSL